ncbi:Uma2 family endonuclease [Knoellia koreensis]|jgi:Uma2 family endonuclease|nr:Uma2 family endonuclease [Knoellia sp. DB2414S]
MESTGLVFVGEPFTRADLEAMPDDGRRHELIDGTLLVTPAPTPRHQRVSMRLSALLYDTATPGFEVLTAPLDVVLADDTVVQPDLLVARGDAFSDKDLPVAPLLAVEILSPSTRLIDLNLKKARYELAGCPHYWVVDPQAPSLTAWALRDGAYVEVASVSGDETYAASEPFAVEVTPSALVADR